MKERDKLIKEADSIGFDPDWTANLYNGENWYRYLCELQKWLRDERKIIVYVRPCEDVVVGVRGFQFCMENMYMYSKQYKQWEQALEKGIEFAIKYINEPKYKPNTTK